MLIVGVVYVLIAIAVSIAWPVLVLRFIEQVKTKREKPTQTEIDTMLRTRHDALICIAVGCIWPFIAYVWISTLIRR